MKTTPFLFLSTLWLIGCNKSESTNFSRVPSNQDVGTRHNVSFSKIAGTAYGWDDKSPTGSNYSQYASVEVGKKTGVQIHIVPLQKEDKDTIGNPTLVPVYSNYFVDVEDNLSLDGKVPGDTEQFGDLGANELYKPLSIGAASEGTNVLIAQAQGKNASMAGGPASGPIPEAEDLNGVRIFSAPLVVRTFDLYSSVSSDLTGMLVAFNQAVVKVDPTTKSFPSGWDLDHDGELDLSPYPEVASEEDKVSELIGGNDPSHLRMLLFKNFQVNFRVLDQDTLTNPLGGGFGGYQYILDIPYELDGLLQKTFVKIGNGDWPYKIFTQSYDGISTEMSDLDIDVFRDLYDKNGDGKADPDEVVFILQWKTNIKLSYVALNVAVENCTIYSGRTVGFDDQTGVSEGWAYVLQNASQVSSTRTVAHEMGHLLGLPHCLDDAGCAGTGYNLMDQDKDLRQGVNGDFLAFGQWKRLHL